MSDRPRFAELGHFLRTRRERLSPEAVGLPAGPRRRTSGLRREEVAVLANVSTTWYTYLEQGREIRPSAEILDSFANALRLDHTERRYLHALGASPASSVLPDPTPDAEAIALVCRLMDVNSDMPYPVYATDGMGGLLAWNMQMSEWYSDFSESVGRSRNIVWWLFTAPEAAERIAEWDRDAREMVARIRFFVGTCRPHHIIDGMVRDLCEVSADFARWWDEHDVVDQEARARTFHHPRLGTRTLQLLVVRPSISPSVSIVFHLPPAGDTE